MNRHRPLLGRLPQLEKQQLQRGFFVGESAASFDDLAQRPIQRFHAVGGVDRLTDVRARARRTFQASHDCLYASVIWVGKVK